MTDMTPKEVFERALDADDDRKRSEIVDESCGPDTSLRNRVQALLAAHFRNEEFLEHPLLAQTADKRELRRPEQIGPYRIREQLGEGGYGIVYTATQTKPLQRDVAIKVIKPGMDTRQVVRRFEAERQALALMDHPNVATVFDAGETENGHPYFVMELVRGCNITEFCDKEKLTINERLRMFVTVCRAVQHAHQKGVIHRDLKPSNILVAHQDSEPTVKVIDFGIAKALDRRLTEESLYTDSGQMLGTPLYMSPEQAERNGADVDTRSDVYSLGVLLYEILTGETPFTRDSLKDLSDVEMRRVICLDEPQCPSARVATVGSELLSTISDRRGIDAHRIVQRLRGELDWIVGKALSKDRRRRYDSVSALANDVENFLSGTPVIAAPPSKSYQVRKLIHRHRRVLIAGTLVAASLVAGVSVAIWQAVVAHDARSIAEDRLRQSTRLAAEALVAHQKAEASAANAGQSAERFRALSYTSDIRLAFDSFHRNQYSRMRLPLERHQHPGNQPDYRGFAWHYLWNQTRLTPEEPLKSELPLRAMALSPDGRLIAVAGDKGKIWLFNATTWTLVNEFEDSNIPLRSLAFSNDSRLLAVGTVKNKVGVRTVEKGSPVFRFSPMFSGNPVRGLAFSPDDKILIASSGDIFSLFNPRTGQRLTKQRDQSIEENQIPTIAVSSNGLLACASSLGHVSLWEISKLYAYGTREQAKKARPLVFRKSATGAVRTVAFTPNGKLLIYGDTSGKVVFRDVVSGNVLAVEEFSAAVSSLAVTESAGRWRVVVGDKDGNMHLLSVSKQNESTLELPPSRRVARIKQWRAHSREVTAVVFTRKNDRIVSIGTDGRLRVWPLPRTRTNLVDAELAGDQSVFLDDHRVLTSDCCRAIYDLRSREWKMVDIADHRSWDSIRRAAGNGQVFAAERNTGIYAWKRDGDSLGLVWKVPPTNTVERFEVTPDGRTLCVVVSDGGKWQLYLRAGDETLQIPVKPIRAMAVSRDGGYLAFDQGRRLSIVETSSGRVVRALTGHQAAVNAMTFLDGVRRLATVGEDRLLHVWNLETQKVDWSEFAHRRSTRTIAVSPDGETIVTGGGDGRIRFWRWRLKRQLAELRVPTTSVKHLAFSPTGRRLLVVSSDGTRILDSGEWQGRVTAKPKEPLRPPYSPPIIPGSERETPYETMVVSDLIVTKTEAWFQMGKSHYYMHRDMQSYKADKHWSRAISWLRNSLHDRKPLRVDWLPRGTDSPPIKRFATRVYPPGSKQWREATDHN